MAIHPQSICAEPSQLLRCARVKRRLALHAQVDTELEVEIAPSRVRRMTHSPCSECTQPCVLPV